MAVIPTALEAQRIMVTTIGEKLRKDQTPTSIERQAKARWPHWWQRRLRREWVEGYRLAVARCENTVWHSMP